MDIDVSNPVARYSLLRKPDVLFASLKAPDCTRWASAQCGNDRRYSETRADNDNSISGSDYLV
jgi:hypothetical protein